MQRLRQARFLARLVLVWFALALGAAMASPVVHPQAAELVCSGGEIKRLVLGDADAPAPSHTLDCPLCAGFDAPLPRQQVAGMQPGLSYVLQRIPAAQVAARTAAPLPARGPPGTAPI